MPTKPAAEVVDSCNKLHIEEQTMVEIIDLCRHSMRYSGGDIAALAEKVLKKLVP